MGWKSRLSDWLKLGCTIGPIRSNQWWLDVQLQSGNTQSIIGVGMGPIFFNTFITTSMMTPSAPLANLQSRGDS